MTITEIISLVITIIGLASFAAIFTLLYRSNAKAQIADIEAGKRDSELLDEVIYERREEVKKQKKITAVLKTVFFYVIIIIFAPLFVFSIVNRITGNTMMIGNKTVMVVASGSMSEKNEVNTYLVSNDLNNQFQTYDIIVLEKVVNASDIQLYDVVAYKNDEGTNVIHRIIAINADGSYITRGDANNGSDRYNPTFSDIIGRYNEQRARGIGILVMFLQSYAGIITIISLFYCLIMIDRVSERIQSAKNKRTKELEVIIGDNGDNPITSVKTEFQEVVYLNGFAYYFGKEGFIKKEPEETINNSDSNQEITKK